MTALIQRLRHRFLAPGRGGRDRATHDDVYYAYRLILRREPDADGVRFWTRQIEEQRISVDFLVDRFLESAEFLDSTFARTLATGSSLKLVEAEGFRIFVRGDDLRIGAALQRTRVWEPHVGREIRRALGPGGVFVDLGAGIGYFTLLAASIIGAGGRVFAFEPEPVNVALLGMSVRENGFGTVRVHPHAASDRAEMALLGDNLQLRGVEAAAAGRDGGVAGPESGGGHLVQCVVLDEVLRDIGRLDVVKIDVEGAEPRALGGMRDLITRHRPVILTEFFPDAIRRVSGCAPQAYLDQLRAPGYELFVNGPSGPGDVPVGNADVLDHPDLQAHLLLDLVARPRTIGPG